MRSRLSPLTSCRKDMSPTTRVAPRLRPYAKPAAALITPSMPLAPRFAATAAPMPEPLTWDAGSFISGLDDLNMNTEVPYLS